MILTAQQNDTLDNLLYRHYGAYEGLLEIALDYNPHLAHQPILRLGQTVRMPEFERPTAQQTKPTIQLWD